VSKQNSLYELMVKLPPHIFDSTLSWPKLRSKCVVCIQRETLAVVVRLYSFMTTVKEIADAGRAREREGRESDT